MSREYEHEVLKRHDVYVVRNYETGEYQVLRCYMGVAWWETGPEEKAYEFRFKWRAILHAKSAERIAKRAADELARAEARKAATEVRVWR